ncbi:MAG: hypothetical protein JK586_11535 [Nocardiopsis sp. BM-2018]|nr:MAG: hypothetical protein JK586_11535 [Nocardiopsis sp. BM-2018]
MLPSPDPALAVFLSTHHDDAVVAVHNLAAEPRRLDLAVPALAGRQLRLGFAGGLADGVEIGSTASAESVPVALRAHGYAWWWPTEREA